jgi:fatty-acyl-CoA synthase
VTIDPLGYVRLVDRLKDLVKSGGEWISSVELEKALEEHPGVAEAAVISMPDARWGERPLALVTCVPDWKFDAQALREHLAIRVPKWMVPEQILEEPHLPRTTVGKLDKAALRRRFASQ